MRLGLGLGFLKSGSLSRVQFLVEAADRSGYDSVWTAEAYGSDAVSPLAWLGATTSSVRLGTAVMQIPARAPAATGMVALTLDELSGGRFVLGLGVSGPQVAEGWYGQPFARPLARTREYLDIVRAVTGRKAPVQSSGPHYPLPLPSGTGLGKPLRSILHPYRPKIPVFLGAEGPKNMALAAEIADGLLTGNFVLGNDTAYRAALAEGFARPGARQSAATFEVGASVAVIVDDDIERAADALRPSLAFTIGGMGHETQNFHANALSRAGWEAEVNKVRDAFSQGHRDAAAAAIPTDMVQQVALIGPVAKIRDDLAAWEESVVTLLILRNANPERLRLMADLLL